MKCPLRLLIVEDVADDAELVILALNKGGLEPIFERVETADELRLALNAGPWDAVLSDYTLPGFGANAALGLVRAVDPDLPFIVVSGSIGEDVAVELLHLGANDYVLKHNLARLAPAVNREVIEAENRRSRRAAELQVQQLAAIVSDSTYAIISQTLDGIITTWNAGAERLYGYAAAEAIGGHISFLLPSNCADDSRTAREKIGRGESVPAFDAVRLHKNGNQLNVSLDDRFASPPPVDWTMIRLSG